MWVKPESRSDLKSGVKFQMFEFDGDDLMYEGQFIDDTLNWKVEAQHRGQYKEGNTVEFYDWVELSQYRIWKEEMTPQEYLAKVFDVLTREWNKDRLCGGGSAEFVESVIQPALRSRLSVEEIKGCIIKFFYSYEYNISDYQDLLSELEVDTTSSKVTVTFDVSPGTKIDGNDLADIVWWMRNNSSRMTGVNAKVEKKD